MTAELEKITLAQTKAFTLYRLANNILFYEYKDNLLIKLDDVQDAFNLYTEHSPNLSFKVLISFGKFATITPEARIYSEEKVMPTPAQAVVVMNLAQRIIAKFYKTIRKDKHPLKIFKNIEDGIAWLNEKEV